jgi:phosphatidyl-myo-inositol alpha-mannosyltransferase
LPSYGGWCIVTGRGSPTLKDGMNIAMISLYLPSDSKIGSGYQAHYMANAMVQRGHGVTVFSPCERPEDARYQHVRMAVGDVGRTFRFAWNLRRVDWSRFDVLHAHGDDYWLWGHSKPLHVRTMHGSCFAEAANVPGVKEKLRMAMLGISEVIATAVADRTVCVSRDTLRYYPWVKDVIVNGVDLQAFHPGQMKESEPTILFVGTYHNRKRGKMLMEAFESVIRPALPAARLWMVCGDAPAAAGMTVFGRVTTERLADLYRRAWVFCLPSSYEGFGVPYIEAMASGTSVVATPNPGALEVLDGGKYGAIAEPRQIGAAVLELLKDEPRRNSIAAAGLERAQEYSWDRVVAAYERIYTDVAAERQRAGRPVPRAWA